MAKGGRYLNKAKKEKKKGRGWKVFLIVMAVLVVLLGAAGFFVVRYYNSMLGLVNRAEVVEQNQDKSYEDLMAEIYGGVVVDDTGAEETAQQPNMEETTLPETTAQ